MAKVMRHTGLTLVNFSIRAYDTNNLSASQIETRLLRRVQPGDILLLHDGAARTTTPNRESLLKALPRIVDTLQDNGLEFVTA